MKKLDLDAVLDAMAKPVPAAIEAEARRVAEATMPLRLRHGRPPRARWFIPVVVTGAMLTAGAGTAAINMAHWASVSMPIGNVRNTEPIPVTWITESGHSEECRVWIEIRNPQPQDQSTLNAAIAAHDWSGLGQQIYDALEPVPSDSEGESRVGRGLQPVIKSFVAETLPGLDWFSAGASARDRAIDAWGMTCAPETQ